MAFTHILVLALIQGMTEFIPVSSSGHLNLLHALTDYPDHGVRIDIALHTGTLIAALVYFRHDVRQLLVGGIDLLRRRDNADAQRAGSIALASLPVLIGGGLVLGFGLDVWLRHAEIIAWASIVFAVPLWLADRYGRGSLTFAHVAARPAFAIGLAQMLALIPGASRAGVTIMAARALGMPRVDAARFSMLLSIPVIGASTLAGVMTLGNAPADPMPLLWAAGAAAAIAFATIHLFVKMTEYLSLTPFVVYRVVLGVALLWVL